MGDSSNPAAIVIGAGVVGCSIAFHLARAGARVTVFEQGEICTGMSARSGALVRMHYTFAPEVELALHSLGYFTDWRQIVGGECGFVRTGFALVAGARNITRLRSNVAMMRQVGVEVSVCSPDELRKIDPAVNTDDIAVAAYEPQSGYADPVATTQSFAAAAGRYGAKFVLSTPVTGIETTQRRATGVRTGGRTVTADLICIAAGPWTDRLLEPLGIRIGLKMERAQIAFFRRSRGLRHLAYIDCINGSYFRPHGTDATLAGMGEWRAEPQPDPDNFNQSNDPEFVKEMHRRLAMRIPELKETAYSRGHAGVYDVSPDSRAVLGRIPGIDSLWVAAGFSGTGFKTAPAVGAAMAELMLDGRSEIVDISAFSFERILNGRLISTENEYELGAGFGHSI
jgi:sarcosine oxidase, subunit beta